MWADVGTTPSDFDFDDFGATAWAGLVFAPKNLSEFFEIIAFGAVGFDIGRHSGTARGNGAIHYFPGGY